MRQINEQVKSNPRLADKVIEALKSGLLDRLSWLDQAFGRVWKITNIIDGRRYVDPCIYTTGNKYESLVPSADLGNYCFFTLNDPTEVGEYGVVTQSLSMILWVDLNRCYTEGNRRDTENIKEEVLAAIDDIGISGGSVSVAMVYEEPQNVFRGFTLDETQNQFMTHPYAGFRFDMTMTAQMTCES